MKYRSGFVSNSSSSSFLIPLGSMPDDIEALKKQLFGDGEKEVLEHWDGSCNVLFYCSVAETIFNDFRHVCKAANAEVYQEMFNAFWIETYKGIGRYRIAANWETHNKISEIAKKRTIEAFKKSLKKYPQGYKIISYSDNDGWYFSYIEQRVPWYKIDGCIVVSHH